MAELWGIFCEDFFLENQLHYNSTPLYIVQSHEGNWQYKYDQYNR